ncbi:hypothetical protein VTK26DRAFT_3717 [Humicola hyalothermophila]
MIPLPSHLHTTIQPLLLLSLLLTTCILPHPIRSHPHPHPYPSPNRNQPSSPGPSLPGPVLSPRQPTPNPLDWLDLAASNVSDAWDFDSADRCAAGTRSGVG